MYLEYQFSAKYKARFLSNRDPGTSIDYYVITKNFPRNAQLNQWISTSNNILKNPRFDLVNYKTHRDVKKNNGCGDSIASVSLSLHFATTLEPSILLARSS